MSQALSNLLALLNLEKLRKGCFAGRAKTRGYVRFWRPVVGQALYAAKRPCPLSVWFIRFTATFFARR